MDIDVYVMDVNENGVVYSGYITKLDNKKDNIEKYLGSEYTEIPFVKDIVIIVSKNQEKLPVNRVFIRNDKERIFLHGKIICVRKNGEEITSITPDDVNVIRKYLTLVFDLGENYVIGE